MSARGSHADEIAAQAMLFETFLEQLRTDLATSSGGVTDQGAKVVTVGGVNLRAMASAGTLLGFSLRETTGAAAALVYVRDGADAGGKLLSIVSLAAGESIRDWFGPGGLSVGAGVYLDVTAGQVEGAVYLGGAEQ